MNKKEIIKKLQEYNFDKNKYIVLSGASMVLQKVKKETSNIDISVTKDYYDYLLENYNCEFKEYNKYNNKVYTIDNCIYFGIDFYTENKEYVFDIPCQTLEDILTIKKDLNRKKDQADIKKLDLAICVKDTYQYERKLLEEGYSLIAGVDEVGRGPLVGPVVAAAVILPKNYKLEGLTDSKK